MYGPLCILGSRAVMVLVRAVVEESRSLGVLCKGG